jgi:4a-hydroxytetrahydrobiopterin dehydratase
MKEPLSDNEKQRLLGSLPGWSRKGDVLTKTFQFRDFTGAMELVNNVARVAERANHHPDIDVRFNKVILALTTHDAGGITKKDLDLATEIEAL